ncbi:unnamed protein product [Paramecium sonneborni]|uniref:Uncharacterized protein n=1 Tax=Paramecium sonneborni TaxID=65129 RepID=A0A8S1PHN0_9CILI|nr:unnamed protein product [Paramecium sonneborni]
MFNTKLSQYSDDQELYGAIQIIKNSYRVLYRYGLEAIIYAAEIFDEGTPLFIRPKYRIQNYVTERNHLVGKPIFIFQRQYFE